MLKVVGGKITEEGIGRKGDAVAESANVPEGGRRG